MSFSFGPRSFKGCWTCRLRRKKCDESRPTCDACSTLYIDCHYGQGKPAWMDGGVAQEDVIEKVKRDIKSNAHLRREKRSVAGVEGGGGWLVGDQAPSDSTQQDSRCYVPNINSHDSQGQHGATCLPDSEARCTLSQSEPPLVQPLKQADFVLLTFYLEHVLPFLFPFYNPSILHGGRAWILNMTINSPVVRQATLCQGSYFYSLAGGMNVCTIVWSTILSQTHEAFSMLRRAMGVIAEQGVGKHLHGATRILASIMQVQRFEITISSFENCGAHLRAALAIFTEIMTGSGAPEGTDVKARSEAVIGLLGPSAWILPTDQIQVLSAEQTALRFSGALLVFDDTIASTMLQQTPTLHEYHQGLLSGPDPALDLEAVLGIPNWIILCMGEIATLDTWKQSHKANGTLNIMELATRATSIKTFLEAHILQVDFVPTPPTQTPDSILAFISTALPSNNSPIKPTITRIWARAVSIYLHTVVSGWQPSSPDICHHVSEGISLMTHGLEPKSLMRAMVWPFCVIGCFAESAHEAEVRGLVAGVQPLILFGTVQKALGIMENVWRRRDNGGMEGWEFKDCFAGMGELVLLV